MPRLAEARGEPRRIMKAQSVERAYALARERYAELGIDTAQAIRRLARIPLSIHCWQGDDVGGFETAGGTLGDGLAVTGNYPGKARTADQLRADFEKALALVPGTHRFNLHACYAEMGARRVERDALSAAQFKNWIAWAKARKIALDFNQTYFSHPKVDGGMTLTHPDKGIRRFWIEHGIRCREIGAAFGKALGKTCLTNLWIPDGMKDTPADRRGPRQRLAESLDAIFARKINPVYNVDTVEPKLFGIGAESYTPGSHEFYLGYAVSRKVLLTLDAGHYHPTEGIADKISSALCFLPEIALHVSRGVRWDSDHVVIFDDELKEIAKEIVRCGALDRVLIGLDYFDASINRVAAWVTGVRNMQKALLYALLLPHAQLRQWQDEGNFTQLLTLGEEMKFYPYADVWARFCELSGVAAGCEWFDAIRAYENEVISKRR